jgi:hypothetical protein
MRHPLSLFVRTRPLIEVAVAGALVSLVMVLTGDTPLPSLSSHTRAFAASTTFRLGPVLASVVVLALLACRVDEWEDLAARPLTWRRLAMGLFAIGVAVGLLLPAAALSTASHPVLVVVQGVLACCGLGMIASRWLPYSGQAAVAFCYGLVSLNAAWAADGPWGDLLAVGVPPTPARLTIAGSVAVVGLAISATRSGRLA